MRVTQVRVGIERNFRPDSTDQYTFEKIAMEATATVDKKENPKTIRKKLQKELRKEIKEYIEEHRH